MTFNVSRPMAFKMAEKLGHCMGERKAIRGGSIRICTNKKCGCAIISTHLLCTGSAIQNECREWEVIKRAKDGEGQQDFSSPHKELGIKCQVTAGVRKDKLKREADR